MRRLEDLIDLADRIPEPLVLAPSGQGLPHYFLHDPEVVGYPDIEMQNEIYEWVMHRIKGIDPLTNGYLFNVVDVGAGRGDFYSFLKKYTEYVNYKGFELNSNLVEASKQLGRDCVTHKSFLDTDVELDDSEAWVTCIGSLNQYYEHNESDKYLYLSNIIRHSMRNDTKGLILVLLNVADDESFCAFPIHEVASVLQHSFPEFPYVIDYSKYEGVYLLQIYNNTF